MSRKSRSASTQAAAAVRATITDIVRDESGTPHDPPCVDLDLPEVDETIRPRRHAQCPVCGFRRDDASQIGSKGVCPNCSNPITWGELLLTIV